MTKDSWRNTGKPVVPPEKEEKNINRTAGKQEELKKEGKHVGKDMAPGLVGQKTPTLSNLGVALWIGQKRTGKPDPK